MTKSELNKRTYLEAYKAIVKHQTENAIEDEVAAALEKLKESFYTAAWAIKESQDAGVDP